MNNYNEFDQVLGELVANWTPAKIPERKVMQGQYCRVVPLDIAKHGAELFKNLSYQNRGETWTYLPYGPFENKEAFCAWLSSVNAEQNTILYTILNRQDEPLGMAGYLRFDPEHGAVEVGHVHYSKLLQKTKVATEAMYLMMKYVFDELGYRRYEWKCNALNKASRAAALRLGFKFEGIFRQHYIFKQRSRDTAWFSIIDGEWAIVKKALESWLDKANFTADDKQITSLQDLRARLTPMG